LCLTVGFFFIGRFFQEGLEVVCIDVHGILNFLWSNAGSIVAKILVSLLDDLGKTLTGLSCSKSHLDEALNQAVVSAMCILVFFIHSSENVGHAVNSFRVSAIAFKVFDEFFGAFLKVCNVGIAKLEREEVAHFGAFSDIDLLKFFKCCNSSRRELLVAGKFWEPQSEQPCSMVHIVTVIAPQTLLELHVQLGFVSIVVGRVGEVLWLI
jgi:hypothetical protein